MRHVKEGVTEEEINNLINAETWKNGEEWQEYFDIEISEANHAAAAKSEYLDKYRNLPENLREKPKFPEKKYDMEQLADAVADRVLERMGGKESAKKTNEDTEKQAAEILEDLDYI